jgi:hypothetical protein
MALRAALKGGEGRNALVSNDRICVCGSIADRVRVGPLLRASESLRDSLCRTPVGIAHDASCSVKSTAMS